ncbi:GNAT family N-acetyltransferase [Actinomadura opuntiae]|uniref:GNAT family N-acetyltransferase n=1 Tax=Actinomadura sp. OS1-43 TaxID=604315 RepID=UPI00255B10C7|nr:GNAT family N-acetyltransferase [Actinomadura sp. OS1-43]MDL4822061.1 GNAT family N-acetyltransferase [Actinomadura sp. OS1-43]
MDETPPTSVLRGNGLVLREWTDDDLDTLVALLDDPLVARRTPLASPFDRPAAHRYLEQAREAIGRGERVQLAITTDGFEAKGEIRLNLSLGTISYVIGAKHRGQRLASRALQLMTGYAHTQAGLPRTLLEIEPDNEPSIAVARAAGYRPTDAPVTVIQGERRTFTLFTWAHTAP